MIEGLGSQWSARPAFGHEDILTYFEDSISADYEMQTRSKRCKDAFPSFSGR